MSLATRKGGVQKRILTGKKGGVDLNTVRLHTQVSDVLPFLNNVNNIGLSKEDKSKVYMEVVYNVKIKSLRNIIPLLIKFAKQGLPKDVTEHMFNVVISWFGRQHPELSRDDCETRVATDIYDSFTSCALYNRRKDCFLFFIVDENGEDKQSAYPHDRDLLVKTYTAMSMLQGRPGRIGR